MKLEEGEWILHIDGSSNVRGAGVGIVLTSPTGNTASRAVRCNHTKHGIGGCLFPGKNLRDPLVLTPRSQIKSKQEQQFWLQTSVVKTRMFPKRRAKTNPLQHHETSSSPQKFQARNAAYERIKNLQHRETSQTPEDSFFDEISFLDKNTFLEDQTVIRTNIFSKHILRETRNGNFNH